PNHTVTCPTSRQGLTCVLYFRSNVPFDGALLGANRAAGAATGPLPPLDNRAGSHRNLAADAIAFQRCANRISDRLSCGKCETKTPCGIQFWRRDSLSFFDRRSNATFTV